MHDWFTLHLQLRIPYLPTPIEVVDKMLELVHPTPNDVLFDLGCGDGRIVIMAVLKYGCVGVGVDINEKRLYLAMKNVYERDVPRDRIIFLHGDLFSIDLRRASIVTLYLTPSALKVLKRKLEMELCDGARVVSHDYEVPGWKPVEVEEVLTESHVHILYLYEMERPKRERLKRPF